MAATATRPERNEAIEYYFNYIDRVPDGDVVATLDAQLAETLAFLRGIPEEKAGHRYEPGKWSVAEVVSHMNDTERVFAFRAFWFARGLDLPLPSMDPDVAASNAAAGDRPWSSHVAEFAALRASTVELFRNLSAEAWSRQGVASDNVFTVRAIAYILAGHVLHHGAILRERYLVE